jgi:hypothetical protein
MSGGVRADKAGGGAHCLRGMQTGGRRLVGRRSDPRAAHNPKQTLRRSTRRRDGCATTRCRLCGREHLRLERIRLDVAGDLQAQAGATAHHQGGLRRRRRQLWLGEADVAGSGEGGGQSVGKCGSYSKSSFVSQADTVPSTSARVHCVQALTSARACTKRRRLVGCTFVRARAPCVFVRAFARVGAWVHLVGLLIHGVGDGPWDPTP